MKTIELREKRRKLLDDCRAIVTAAETDGRAGLNSDEEARYDPMYADAEVLDKDIARLEKLEAAEADGERSIRPRPDLSDPPEEGDSEPRSGRATATPEYREAWSRFLLKGVRRGLVTIENGEQRALSVDSDIDGGFFVAEETFAQELLKDLDDEVFIRGLARTFPVTMSKSLGAPRRTARASTFGWSSEIGAPTVDSSLKFGKRNLYPHPCTGEIKVSRDFLQMAVMGPEEIVRMELARDAGEVQEDAFLTGTGANQPLGIFTASGDGISTGRDVSTGNTATAFTVDGLKEAKYSLKGGYWAGSTWVFHRDAVKLLAKLKDGDGRFLWEDSIRNGEPDRLLGRPVVMSERAPSTFTTGLYVGILGDFTHYWIADGMDMEVQRLTELYARTNQIGFIGRLKTDGMPVTEEAFARVKLA